MLDLLSELLGGPLERKAIRYGEAESIWGSLFGGAFTKSRQTVSAERALRVSTVLACCRVLAEGVAQVPILVKRKRGRQSVAATEHRLFDLLSKAPNEFQSSFEFRETMMYHALLTGNAVAVKNTNTRGEVVELLPIRPDACQIEQQPDWSILYRLTLPGGRHVVLSQGEVLHIRGPSWIGHAGMDIVRLAQEAIGLAMATEETHALLHGNGGQPAGILSGDFGSEDARKRLKASWSQAFGGGNKYGVAVLDKEVKYQQLAMKGVDAEHLETRKFQIDEICRSMKCSPFMIYHDEATATHAASEQFLRRHVVHDLNPWFERWEQALERQLIRRNDISVEFLDQSLMRGDTEVRSKFYQSGVLTGWMTRNEARVMEGLDPLDGLDEPLMPANMLVVGDEGAGDEAMKARFLAFAVQKGWIPAEIEG